jgi:predicted enzyme related to lactoylglutathione lyase
MSDYHDWNMTSLATGVPCAGIRNERGENLGFPDQWLMYVTVAGLDASLAACRAKGGAAVRDATPMGAHGRYAVIRDPAGAVAALVEPSRHG